MSLKKKTNIFHTVVFRITAWYAAIFAAALIAVFIVSKMFLSTANIKIIDRALYQESLDFDTDLKKESLEEIKNDINEDAQKEGLRKVFYRLLSSNSAEIQTSNLSEWKHLNYDELDEWARLSRPGNVIYRTISFPDKQLNTRVISRTVDDGKYILQIGRAIHENQVLINRYSALFGGIVIVMLLCGIGLGWGVTKKTIGPVERITQTALKIGNEGFKHRVRTGNEGEEIDRLAKAFNGMLDRIEILMSDLRDVTDNIAHDLRTPITRIRAIAETTLQGGESRELSREGFEAILEECAHLVNLINTILDISEADAGLKKSDISRLDLVSLAKKGYDLFLPVAEDNGISLHFRSSHESIYVPADAPRLQRVVSNLLDNAIKFTKENGNVFIELDKEEENAEISVRDTGIGIDKENLTHIFEKFYRGESSRSTTGNGLGLTWVRSMVTTMGGTIAVQSELGKGSTFTVSLPLSPS